MARQSATITPVKNRVSTRLFSDCVLITELSLTDQNQAPKHYANGCNSGLSQVRRELLHKATVTVAELNMALHDANEEAEKANEQVQIEKRRVAKLESDLKQVSTALHSNRYLVQLLR